MSVIVKFADEERRDQYLEHILSINPELLGSIALNALLPHLYINGPAETDKWLIETTKQFGQLFADVQFEPYEH